MKAFGLVALAALMVCACKGNQAPSPTKDPPPVTASLASASAAAPEREAAPAVVPTLVAEPFAPPGTHLRGLFPIEGALAVTEEQRVGRIAGDGVEWLDAKVPKETLGLGGRNLILSVHGRWPDRVDATTVSDGGRVLGPQYFPLTGKGTPSQVGFAGGYAYIAGVTTVGESTVMAGYAFLSGAWIGTGRGPEIRRALETPKQAGCKDLGKNGPTVYSDEATPAIIPLALGSTREGTLMSVGWLCARDKPAAEIWDKAGKDRIVDLSPWVKSVSPATAFVQGKGDELWLVPVGADPILHYQDGKFDPLPSSGGVIAAFLSPSGELYTSDGQTIRRWADGKWTPAARLAWPLPALTMAIENDTFWAGAAGAFYRLRKGESVEMHDGCATPFVYLYEVKADNAKDFTFPTTRKALGSFAEVADLGLVEFQESGRRLGITVKSKAQGEAVVAHVKTTMPKETPRLICYAPRDPRRIELTPKRL